MSVILLVVTCLLVVWGVVRGGSFAARGEVAPMRSLAALNMAKADLQDVRGNADEAQQLRVLAANQYFQARHLEALLDRVDRWTWPKRWPR